ncbi:MAG TPA: hypothetical protein VGZ23_02315 [bacterium]|nr:hypothetical protein [bacterium]
MKPAPPPKVPGSTPWERMDSAVRMVLSVPKEAVLKEEARLKKLRARKRAKKRGH